MRRGLWLFLSVAAGLWGNAGLAAEFAMADDANRSTAAPAIDGNPSSAESIDAAGAAGSCRLVRSATATAERGAAAIPHAVDIERSDPRLAGLMLRCGKQGGETVVVVVESFPPHARPQITLSTRGYRRGNSVARRRDELGDTPLPDGWRRPDRRRRRLIGPTKGTPIAQRRMCKIGEFSP